MEYLINIVLAANSYWAVALVLYAIYLFLNRKVKQQDQVDGVEDAFYTKYVPHLQVAAIAVFVLGVFIGVTSPSNTYKNTVDYNKTQDIQRIQQLNSQRAPAEIQDTSRQPQTAEERASSSIDMRTRVESVQEQ